jgi:hypothetical protein
MNKKQLFENAAPQAHNRHDANRIIQERWNKRREYTLPSRNSSKSPPFDSPAAKAERKSCDASWPLAITEYQLFHGQCRHCDAHKSRAP